MMNWWSSQSIGNAKSSHGCVWGSPSVPIWNCDHIQYQYFPRFSEHCGYWGLIILRHQVMTPTSECCRRNWDSSDQETSFQTPSFQLLVSRWELRFLFLGHRGTHTVWFSAAVAHLLQTSMCCAFRNALMHILVITSGYLSYCCLSTRSKQSGHSLLNFGIFIKRTAAHWTFSMFQTVLCKPQRVLICIIYMI